MTQSPREASSTSLRTRFARFLARLVAGRDLLASVSVRVDDSAGWQAYRAGPNDRDISEIVQQYSDALEAWRKNPFAKRIVDLTTDFCLGDGLTPTAPGEMGRFVRKWWYHPKNNMPLRLPALVDELGRAGDLFLTLHRNPVDGISYVRPIPKDRIQRIETQPNDWETEIAYYETRDTGEPRKWLSPNHPAAQEADAVMVHYAVNRVVGALMGESDLGSIIPWLLRYSRLVEDRVRMHWASKLFLWIVTVPPGKVQAKSEQYRQPPDPGSVIVKDDSEAWDVYAPDLKAFDAQFDLRAVRQLIDAGSGMPPHWRGEPHDVSLATAEAMERAASRHLRRRQLMIRHMLIDLCYIAYARAHDLGIGRYSPRRELITVALADIDREDNKDLAVASLNLATAMETLTRALQPEATPSSTLRRLVLNLITRFAGEPLDDRTLDAIMKELAT